MRHIYVKEYNRWIKKKIGYRLKNYLNSGYDEIDNIFDYLDDYLDDDMGLDVNYCYDGNYLCDRELVPLKITNYYIIFDLVISKLTVHFENIDYNPKIFYISPGILTRDKYIDIEIVCSD